MTTDRTPAEQLAMLREAIETEWYNGNISQEAHDRLLLPYEWSESLSARMESAEELAMLARDSEDSLSAQLAEQRSITAALVEAGQHAHGCRVWKVLRADRVCDCGQVGRWADALRSSSKAATEWRTQVAKEAVSPDRLWKAMRSLAERPEHPIVISWAGNGPEFKRGISEVEMTEALSALLSEDSK